MIRALDPLFPGFPLRLRSPRSETPLFRVIPHARRGETGTPKVATRWDAPDHWIERDGDI